MLHVLDGYLLPENPNAVDRLLRSEESDSGVGLGSQSRPSQSVGILPWLKDLPSGHLY